MSKSRSALRPCRPAVLALAALGGLVVAPASGQAVDYAAHGNFGLYTSKETYGVPSGGSTTNDGQAVLGSVYLDALKLGPLLNEFTFDMRDRYDSFGSVDGTNSRLVAGNEPALRQLALKSNPEAPGLSYAVGRFPVADAAVLDNDGAELGYHVSPKLKVGAFGGLYAEQVQGQAVPLAEEDHQAGLFAAYKDQGSGWGKNTYASTALVFRQPNPNNSATDTPLSAAPTPQTIAQPVSIDEPGPAANYVFWYTNVIYQPTPETRASYLADFDLDPQVHVRDLFASIYHQLTPKFSGTLSLFHLDLTEYERQRDLSDELPTSAYTELRAEAKYKLSRTYQLVGDVFDGERSADSKSRAEVDAKLVATSLLNGHVSAFGGGGYRKNYLSHDELVKAGGSYYGAKLEFDASQQYIIQNYDGGPLLHQLITDVSVGYLLSEALLGSFTLEYARDEQVTITSALLTLGFRVNNRQLTPIRDRAPRLERVETPL